MSTLTSAKTASCSAIGLWLTFATVLLLSGCSSTAEPNEPSPEGDVGHEVGGSIPSPDVTDSATGIVEPPAPELPTATGIAATAGSAESGGYRLRFSLSAPLRAGPAKSDGFRMNTIISIGAGGANESGAE